MGLEGSTDPLGGLLRAQVEGAQGALGINEGCLKRNLLKLLMLAFKRNFPKIGPKHIIYAYQTK
jgi:hypothetical protein